MAQDKEEFLKRWSRLKREQAEKPLPSKQTFLISNKPKHL